MTIVVTKCTCHVSPGDYKSIETAWLKQQYDYNERAVKIETLDKVIDMMNKQRAVYFHLTLTAGSATYWNHKIQTIDRLITEIEAMK